MKKFASLILALAMCLALAAPAFATSQSGNMGTELSSMLPELKMTLPESTTILLNPYRNQVADSAASAVGIDKGDKLQVMNGVFSILSTTTNKVHVKAVVTGKVGGSVEFASAAVPVGTAGHKVHLTLTYALGSGTTATVPVPDNVDTTKATNMKTISDSEQTLEWSLPAATSTGATATQRVNLQFGGTCSDSPSEDDGPWKETDTVSASFVFTATAVTDDPMVTQMYQATAATTSGGSPTYSDFVVKTWDPKLADFSKIDTGDAPGIKTIEYKKASDSSFTPLDKGNDNWGGCSWDGTKITLKDTKCATVLGATADIKVVRFTLQYTDKSGATQNPTYTVKVNVLAAA